MSLPLLITTPPLYLAPYPTGAHRRQSGAELYLPRWTVCSGPDRAFLLDTKQELMLGGGGGQQQPLQTSQETVSSSGCQV